MSQGLSVDLINSKIASELKQEKNASYSKARRSTSLVTAQFSANLAPNPTKPPCPPKNQTDLREKVQLKRKLRPASENSLPLCSPGDVVGKKVILPKNGPPLRVVSLEDLANTSFSFAGNLPSCKLLPGF